MTIEIDSTKGITQNTTEVTKIPVGTTAQRPSNPAAGMIRFNTDEGLIEGYSPFFDAWIPLNENFVGVEATGGTVTDITQDGLNYRVHTFTSSGTFEVTRGGEVDVLVVGGGGGGGHGGSDGGGGGGAGRLVFFKQTDIAIGNKNVTIGSGGAGGPELDGTRGEVGGDTVFDTFIAVGGGGGGARDTVGGDGGSAGGSGQNVTSGVGTSISSPTVANATIDAGNGTPTPDANSSYGVGGGGAGEPGQTGAGVDLSRGGDGLDMSEFFGTNVGENGFFAGGGGGGDDDDGDNPQRGGIGGGGSTFTTGTTSESGLPNTGGGGGGAVENGSPGAGGSGIVIVRYRIG